MGEALRTLEAEHPGLRDGRWLALFPSNPGGAALPCYRLAVVGGDSGGLPSGVPERLDVLLGELNLEYHAKRASGRLGEIRLSALDRDEFLRRAAGGSAHPDSQFKFQPFYPRLWEGQRRGLPASGASVPPQRFAANPSTSNRAPKSSVPEPR